MAIAAVSSTWFSLVQGGEHHHHHHHHSSKHPRAHNHWNMITKEHTLWPPTCDGELVDEGITHAHALLSATRELVSQNEGLREWITEDANLYDPDMVHVNTRSDLE